MNRIGFALVGGILLSAGGGLVACGGSPPPKEPEPPTQAAPPPKPAAPMKSSQELGQIDEDATNRTFQSLQDKLLNCQKDGITRVEFLAGDAKFFLRIAQDGSVRWAFLEDSTLGDRDTEKCMLQVVSTARWPQPDGGEAEVQKSISFDSGGDTRPPVSWRSDKVAGVVEQEGHGAMKCKGTTHGIFKVTAYVEPGEGGGGGGKKHAHGGGGGPHGKVVAVGVAPPNKDGESQADCIADAVKDWKMPSPGGYAAKVTFSL
jgi:hypothetical protein